MGEQADLAHERRLDNALAELPDLTHKLKRGKKK